MPCRENSQSFTIALVNVMMNPGYCQLTENASGDWSRSGLMFALGVFDDIRAVKPLPKLCGQMAVAALVLWLMPPRTEKLSVMRTAADVEPSKLNLLVPVVALSSPPHCRPGLIRSSARRVRKLTEPPREPALPTPDVPLFSTSI